MGENLIKPYEISVWEEKLTQIENSNPAEYKIKEIKLAVIGSDTMTGYNKIYNPVFSKKNNGEKSLSFSLRYKYFDPYIGNEDVINPFAALLVNERKVKLHYNDEWYEFIIKDHTESSDGLEWTYTCTDAFVLELSKRGYNITFDSELNNNQGTARELAAETLKNTDWQVGTVDVFKQLIAEPIYKATLVSKTGITIVNVNNDGIPIPDNGAAIYLFYSYVKNQDGKNVQFIIQDENRKYTIDDNNVITDTNFRITTPLTYKNNGFYLNNTPIISIGSIESKFQANRLAYNQLTTYDPVMERTVDRFKVQNGDLEIYKYTDYTYTTSNVVMNYITNGDNFNALEDGTLQGWNPYTDQSGGATVNKLELITKPELATGKELADLKTLSEIEGFLKVQFNGAMSKTNGKVYNTVYNSGIQNHGSLLQSISKGQKFVFRWRAGQESNNVVGSTTDLGLIVAKYTQDTPTLSGYYYKHININDIILEFTGTPTRLDNYIEGGTIVNNSDGTQSYVIDGVAQVPSTKYIYKVGNTQYIWQGTNNTFTTNISSYRPYYYITAAATQAVSKATLSDPSVRIGIFIYTKSSANSSNPYFIQDIQLTQFIADSTDATGNTPITIGNIPVSTSESTDYYYIKPTDGMAAEDIQMYTDLNTLKTAKGIQGNIVPLYNENSEKTLSITASQSNCFNILQTIAETFECWIDLVVGHNEQGYITDTEGKPNKYVYLKEYAGKDNWAGFKYGINLSSIERNVNSDEIVSKLIVDMSQSDLVDEGFVSIANAKSNPSGESYILNFDYYYNQGLLNREEAENDRLNFSSQLKELNNQLQQKEKNRRELEAALTSVDSQRNVYTELVETAKENKSEALGEFELLAEIPYDIYQQRHSTLENKDQLTEDETIYATLGKIYTTSSVINSYGGLLSNIDKEYASLRKKLYGAKNYKIKFWSANDANNQRHVFVEFNDYISGVEFHLGSDTYIVTVSQKYFDITSDITTISFSNLPNGYSLSPNKQSYTITKNPQIVRIITSSSEIGIIDEIEEIQNQKDNLTADFNNKYSRYIQEGTWNSTDYIDSELYYLDALQVSNTSAQPVVSYTINVVEISELEDLEDYLFDVGDKTYIEDTEFFGWHADNVGTDNEPIWVKTPAREEVIVSEVEWHLEEPENNVITVQNYKTRFEDLFQRVSAAVQTVQYNEATYAKISTLMDADGTLNQNVLLESLNRISGKEVNLTTDGSIQIHGDEILIHNLTNKSNFVKINCEGIKISSDGGDTWATAISGYGIDIGTVYTGMLNTDQIIVGNKNNPSFRWDKSGISAYRFVNRVEPTRRFMSLRAGVEDDSQGYDLQTFVRFDQYGLYGIKNNGSFKASSLEDVKDKAHFAVTWDGFFIRNSYTDGRVEITSDNDFRVIQTLIDSDNIKEDHERIKIGALEFDQFGNPIKYGININQTVYNSETGQYEDIPAFTTGSDGNITITGTINANAGIFDGLVQVGTDNPYIAIDGVQAEIRSSNYQDGAGYGWMINKDGDAVFNNITARGAIKTAVFEYAEIQAVGGIFIFRPSSTIRNAARVGETDDITITVEKSYLFNVGDWCKISNYTDSTREPNASAILANNGLTHVYKIKSRDSSNTRILVLENAYTALTSGATKVINDITDLIGGALVDMGDKANGDGKIGNNNYGIGINSSDNVVDLPRRAISLFETVVDETKNPKISYNYRGILGTLPIMNSGVDQRIYQYMQGTQGIYTDNMYLGDNNQYLAFYEDANGDKQLRIRANQIVFEVSDPKPGEDPWKDINDVAEGAKGEDAISVEIDSSGGNVFINGIISTILRCFVYKGGVDITHDNNYIKTYTWKKINIIDGSEIPGWTPTPVPLEPNAIRIGVNDVNSKAVFQCTVNVEEA